LSRIWGFVTGVRGVRGLVGGEALRGCVKRSRDQEIKRSREGSGLGVLVGGAAPGQGFAHVIAEGVDHHEEAEKGAERVGEGPRRWGGGVEFVEAPEDGLLGEDGGGGGGCDGGADVGEERADEEADVGEDADQAEDEDADKDAGQGVEADVEDAGPAGPDGAETGVHAYGVEAGAADDVEAEAEAFGAAGEGHVFADGAADGGVTADGFIGFALDEDEGAVGVGVGGLAVVHFFGWEPEDEDAAGGRLHDAFPEGVGVEFGQDGEEVDAVGLGVVDGRGEEVGVVEAAVGIGTEEVLAGGVLDGLVHGVVLAGPAVGEVADVDGLEAGVAGGEFVDDVAGAVGGAVVGDDDLEVGVILGEEAGEAAVDVGFFVLGGDEDGEAGERGGVFGHLGGVEDGFTVCAVELQVAFQPDERGQAEQPEPGGGPGEVPGEIEKGERQSGLRLTAGAA
jgi:hypothetical protein